MHITFIKHVGNDPIYWMAPTNGLIIEGLSCPLFHLLTMSSATRIHDANILSTCIAKTTKSRIIFKIVSNLIVTISDNNTEVFDIIITYFHYQ